MSTLHTVNKSPFEKNSLASCLGYAKEGHSVLLYEDGVYAAVKNTSAAAKIKATEGVKIYALGSDLKTRGIAEDKLLEGVQVVDYTGFVNLAAENDRVSAWV